MKWLNTKLGFYLRRFITMANTIQDIHDNLLALIKQATEHAAQARQRDEAIIAKSTALQQEVANLKAQIERLGVQVDFTDLDQAAGDLDIAVTQIGVEPEAAPAGGEQSPQASQTDSGVAAGGAPPADVTAAQTDEG